MVMTPSSQRSLSPVSDPLTKSIDPAYVVRLSIRASSCGMTSEVLGLAHAYAARHARAMLKAPRNTPVASDDAPRVCVPITDPDE
jgi:hypothetical protein